MFGVPFAHRTIWPVLPLSRRIAELLNFPLALPATPRYWPTPPWACSSVVEHCVDIAGVASSILATPTIENPVKPTVLRGFCLPGGDCERVRAQDIFGQILGISTPLWANSGHEIAGRRERNPDSLTPHGPAGGKRYDAPARVLGRLGFAVAHGNHITTPRRLCVAAKRAISPAGKRRGAAPGLHGARDPPTHTSPFKVSCTLSQASTPDAARAPECATPSRNMAYEAPRLFRRQFSLGYAAISRFSRAA